MAFRWHANDGPTLNAGSAVIFQRTGYTSLFWGGGSFVVDSSNGRHYGVIFFKPEKNLEFFQAKNDPIDVYPGRLE